MLLVAARRVTAARAAAHARPCLALGTLRHLANAARARAAPPRADAPAAAATADAAAASDAASPAAAAAPLAGGAGDAGAAPRVATGGRIFAERLSDVLRQRIDTRLPPSMKSVLESRLLFDDVRLEEGVSTADPKLMRRTAATLAAAAPSLAVRRELVELMRRIYGGTAANGVLLPELLASPTASAKEAAKTKKALAAHNRDMLQKMEPLVVHHGLSGDQPSPPLLRTLQEAERSIALTAAVVSSDATKTALQATARKVAGVSARVALWTQSLLLLRLGYSAMTTPNRMLRDKNHDAMLARGEVLRKHVHRGSDGYTRALHRAIEPLLAAVAAGSGESGVAAGATTDVAAAMAAVATLTATSPTSECQRVLSAAVEPILSAVMRAHSARHAPKHASPAAAADGGGATTSPSLTPPSSAPATAHAAASTGASVSSHAREAFLLAAAEEAFAAAQAILHILHADSIAALAAPDILVAAAHIKRLRTHGQLGGGGSAAAAAVETKLAGVVADMTAVSATESVRIASAAAAKPKTTTSKITAAASKSKVAGSDAAACDDAVDASASSADAVGAGADSSATGATNVDVAIPAPTHLLQLVAEASRALALTSPHADPSAPAAAAAAEDAKAAVCVRLRKSVASELTSDRTTAATLIQPLVVALMGDAQALQEALHQAAVAQDDAARKQAGVALASMRFQGAASTSFTDGDRVSRANASVVVSALARAITSPSLHEGTAGLQALLQLARNVLAQQQSERATERHLAAASGGADAGADDATSATAAPVATPPSGSSSKKLTRATLFAPSVVADMQRMNTSHPLMQQLIGQVARTKGVGPLYQLDAWVHLVQLYVPPSAMPALLPPTMHRLVHAAVEKEAPSAAVREYRGALHHALATLRRAYVGREERRLLAAVTTAAAGGSGSGTPDAANLARFAAGTAVGAAMDAVGAGGATCAAPPVPTASTDFALLGDSVPPTTAKFGCDRLLALLKRSLPVQDRLEFRRVISDLEDYRARTPLLASYAMRGAALTFEHPPMPMEITPSPADGIEKLDGHAAGRNLLKIRAKAASVAGIDHERFLTRADVCAAPWRFVQVGLESAEARSLLERAEALVPRRHRVAIYTYLTKFMGALRVVHIDNSLLGAHGKGSAAAALAATAKPRGDAPRSPGAVGIATAADAVVEPATAGFGEAAPGDASSPAESSDAAAPTPSTAESEAFAFARRLVTMISSREYRRLAAAVEAFEKQVAATDAAERLVQAAMATEASLEAATKAGIATSAERDACNAAQHDARQSLLHVTYPRPRPKYPRSLPFPVALELMRSVRAFRMMALARSASALFGPVAFAVDADFSKHIFNRSLRLETLKRARASMMLEDAEVLVAEELLLDDAGTPASAESGEITSLASASMTADALSSAHAELFGSEDPAVAAAEQLQERAAGSSRVSEITAVKQLVLRQQVLPVLQQLLTQKASPAAASTAPGAASAAARAATDAAAVAAPSHADVLHLKGPWAAAAGVSSAGAGGDRWEPFGIVTSDDLFARPGERFPSDAPADGSAVDDDAGAAPAPGRGRRAKGASNDELGHDHDDGDSTPLVSVTAAGDPPDLQSVLRPLRMTAKASVPRDSSAAAAVLAQCASTGITTTPVSGMVVNVVAGAGSGSSSSVAPAARGASQRAAAGSSSVTLATPPGKRGPGGGRDAGAAASRSLVSPSEFTDQMLRALDDDAISRTICIQKLPLCVSVDAVAHALSKGFGAVQRIDIWTDRADALQRRLALQDRSYARARMVVREQEAAAVAEESTEGGGGAAASQVGLHKNKTRIYKVLEERRRRVNFSSPLVGFATFVDPSSMAKATTDFFRLLGIVVQNSTCTLSPAESERTLAVSNVPKGMPPHAVLHMIADILGPMRADMGLKDEARIRHGMLSNGEILLQFDSHRSALLAAYLLRGTELASGHPFVVGWANSGDWRRAAPRLPMYF